MLASVPPPSPQSSATGRVCEPDAQACAVHSAAPLGGMSAPTPY